MQRLGRSDQIHKHYKYPSARIFSKLLVNKSHSNWLSFLELQYSLLLKQLVKWHASKVTSLCFHLSIHPLEARKSVNSTLLARPRVFSLILFLFTGMLSKRRSLNHSHFHNTLRLFYVLPNFNFTESETMRDYYLQTWYIRVASQVAKRLKT